MLLRSFKIPNSLLLLIVFLAFFGWQLSQGTRHENAPVDRQVIPQTDGDGGNKAPRIALMTFVTDQRSYLHLSLKNKDRKHHHSLVKSSRMLTRSTKTTCAAMATTSSSTTNRTRTAPSSSGSSTWPSA